MRHEYSSPAGAPRRTSGSYYCSEAQINAPEEQMLILRNVEVATVLDHVRVAKLRATETHPVVGERRMLNHLIGNVTHLSVLARERREEALSTVFHACESVLGILEPTHAVGVDKAARRDISGRIDEGIVGGMQRELGSARKGGETEERNGPHGCWC